MKVHYSKILLYFLPLNILVKLSHAYNKNKPYITPHHTTRYTSRVLSEGGIESSIYDEDTDMKSVKEKFDRQTSQRFEEYEECMKVKRQKHKEERDKNIQEIILKDKMDKSLTEKIEKGCLKCGCALGGGVLPVWGLVSGLWYATWSQYVSTTVSKAATDAGISKAVAGLGNIYDLRNLTVINWTKMITVENFKSPTLLAHVVQKVNIDACQSGHTVDSAFCSAEKGMRTTHGLFVQKISQEAAVVAADAGQAAKSTEAIEASKYTSTTSIYSTSIIASVVAILIIVLVMIIIYLVLRYRRKKKMNKKSQYTKLLN
ncbi:rifin [Plasmodium sp. gorilla clade G1]|nr:rifin [Plasmodium sp. gorilla clade G1]